MMKSIALAVALCCALAGAAAAQSAAPVMPGYLSTSGCPSVQTTPCFVPYGSAIPTTDSGTKISAATMPTGGVGLTGWMSAVWYQLTQMVGTAGTPTANVLSVQGVTGGTPAPVLTGTYGRVDASPTVQNASYISGNDIGGLVTFALPATASGILQSISVQFVGGATTAITVNCFDSNPSGSTFTDKSTFTIAAADAAKLINKAGIVLTPAVSVGGTRSAAVFDNYAKPFGSTANIYCAYAAGGTFTPASVSDMNVSIAYYQNAK